MTSRIKWRTQYDEVADAIERENTDIVCEDDSLTIQDAPESDINVIMARFGINDGSALPTTLGQPIDPRYYGDFSDIPDLKEALDRTHDAEAKFMALPAKIRTRFQNDPLELLEWIKDGRNLDEAVRLGLLTKPPQIVNTAQPGATPPNPQT